MIGQWECSDCKAFGYVKPHWREHVGDIVSDTHRDQSPRCHRDRQTGAIRVFFHTDPAAKATVGDPA